MPESKQITLKITSDQVVTAERFLMNVLIVADANIYWEVFTYYNNEIVKKEWYNVSFSSLAGLSTHGGTFLEEIEATLWDQSDQIDSMPTGTSDEIQAKASRYGIMYSYHIG